MSQSVFSRANDKFLNRREFAKQQPASAGSKTMMNISTLAAALQEVELNDILPNDSRQTFAVGLFEGNSLIVANKGVTNGEKYIWTVRKKMSERIGGHIPVTNTAGVESGLHAEMAIVEYLITKQTDRRAATWGLNDVLQIFCIGKPVCPDCAGWLNKHFIPHLSLIKNGEAVEVQYACGKPSQGGQWKHPRTGAMYQSENPNDPKLNTYQKGGNSYNRPFDF
jgi:hypothetical protein